MTPAIVSKNDKLFMVVGTPGGSTIITSVFQTILNVIEYPLGSTFNVTGEIGPVSETDRIYTLELIKQTQAKLELLKYAAEHHKPTL